MKIEVEEYTLKLSYNELYSIAYDIHGNLMNALKTHWVNHQSLWKLNEKERLLMLEIMFGQLGRHDIYEDIYELSEEIFDNYNKKK